VAEPAIAADVHESFDIHGDLTPEVTFYPHFFVDDVAQAVDFIVCQVPNTRVWIDSGASEKLLACVQSDTVDIR